MGTHREVAGRVPYKYGGGAFLGFTSVASERAPFSPEEESRKRVN